MIDRVSVPATRPQMHRVKATPEEEKLLNQALNPTGKKYLNSAKAYQKNKSYLEVIDYGRVTRVLPEDTTGSKHQLFFVKTDSGVLVKVAHNISICERIPDLKPGLRLGIKGEFIHINDLKSGNFSPEFEFDPMAGLLKNEKMAGLIHYTHRDIHGGGHDQGGIVILQKGKHYGKVIT